MGRSNMKLCCVLALFGAILACSAAQVDASSVETAAYRGGVAGGLQQQPVTAAATQATTAQLQSGVTVGAAAYRDKPSLKEYYYGKKNEDYSAVGAAYNSPGYNAQYPNPAYQTVQTTYTTTAPQPVVQAVVQQPMPTQTVAVTQQPIAASTTYYQGQAPQYTTYTQPMPQPMYPKPAYPKADEYAQPAPQYTYQQPYTGGYAQQPDASYGGYAAPKPGYGYAAPAPSYYGASPPAYGDKGKGYFYPKHEPMGICQSSTFGAYYTQAFDDYITEDNPLTGVMSAFMGCKDRTTLGGLCSYTCYDGNYFERFVGMTQRIVASPPQDWDNVDPWDHPVYCAWEMGDIVSDFGKSMPAPPSVSQAGFNFSCDFTIKAICCDDIVPLVPYDGDVDLSDDCGPDGCEPPATGCDEEPCEPCEDEFCEKKTSSGGRKSGTKKSSSKSSKSSKTTKRSTSSGTHRATSRSGRNSKRATLAGTADSSDAGFTSIGNDRVTGGVRMPVREPAAATSMQTVSKAMPAPSQIVQPVTTAAAAPATTAATAAAAAKPQASVAAAKPSKS